MFERLKFYPNPFSDKLFIETSVTKPLDFILFDVTGKQIIAKRLTDSKNKISMKSISTGIYIIEFLDGNKIIHQEKIVKINP